MGKFNVKTRIKQNGNGEMELHWSPLVRAVAKVLIALVITGVLGTLAIWRDVAVIKTDVQNLQSHVEENTLAIKAHAASSVPKDRFNAHDHKGRVPAPGP